MPDHKEQLTSMLMSVIKGDTEAASATMHDYFVAKTREVAGLAEPDGRVEPTLDAEPGSEPTEVVPAE